MADQQQIQNNSTDELDEILVKEPDGTFRVVKVTPGQSPQASTSSANKGTAASVASIPSVSVSLPRVEKPAPSTMVLGDDEAKEFAAIAEKTKTFASPMDDKSTEIARRAIAESGVVLADPSLANRLLTALIASVKEVRKELETRDLLMRAKEQGGLGMTMNEATRLLALLKPPITNPPVGGVVTGQARTTLGVESTPSVNEPKGQAPTTLGAVATPSIIAPQKLVVPPAPKPVVLSAPLPVQKPVVLPPPLPVIKKPITPSVPVTPKSVTTPLPSKPASVPPRVETLPPLPLRAVLPPPPTPPNQPPSQQVMRPITPTKPVVQDVSFTPKLMGPIEELQMSIAEWRRMAPTLKDRGTKIEEKLRLLEEGSYADRLKGVAAWYASDVVRMYQDVGRESLVGGKPIAAVLADREAKGLPTLLLEEFQGVTELNERLRF
ncbi:MAG: hypothetical protein Q7S16_05155 [bacterium]|nr:hypothetical protein [bacterium]